MNATTPSVAEKVGNATSGGNNRAHSNGRSRENKCGDGMSSIEGGSCSIYNGGR